MEFSILVQYGKLLRLKMEPTCFIPLQFIRDSRKTGSSISRTQNRATAVTRSPSHVDVLKRRDLLTSERSSSRMRGRLQEIWPEGSCSVLIRLCTSPLAIVIVSVATELTTIVFA